jgi:hypothetical protein
MKAAFRRSLSYPEPGYRRVAQDETECEQVSLQNLSSENQTSSPQLTSYSGDVATKNDMEMSDIEAAGSEATEDARLTSDNPEVHVICCVYSVKVLFTNKFYIHVLFLCCKHF